jgi:hypothetical protein
MCYVASIRGIDEMKRVRLLRRTYVSSQEFRLHSCWTSAGTALLSSSLQGISGNPGLPPVTRLRWFVTPGSWAWNFRLDG